MKRTFLDNGIATFSDHEILEMLLFYALPRQNTNEIAHELIARFGNLRSVFDAPVGELCQVKGIGEHAAVLIKLVPVISKRHAETKKSRKDLSDVICSSEKLAEYLMEDYEDVQDELVYMVCMNGKNVPINKKCIFRGSINSVDISVRKIVEHALSSNAAKVILAHNHLSGIALPSRADILTTQHIYEVLKTVNVELVDHIIIAEDDFVSMAESGFIGG